VKTEQLISEVENDHFCGIQYLMNLIKIEIKKKNEAWLNAGLALYEDFFKQHRNRKKVIGK